MFSFDIRARNSYVFSRLFRPTGLLPPVLLLCLLAGAAFAQAPNPRADSLSAVANGSTSVPLSTLLSNDELPSGDAWQFRQLRSAKGSIELVGDTLLYTPSLPFGTDRFDYRLESSTDGVGGEAEVWIHVRPGTLPLIGDWNRDGKTDLGWYEAADSMFVLCLGKDSRTCEPRWMPVGEAGWTPLVGHWQAEEGVDLGVYDPATGRLFVTGPEGSRLRVLVGPAGAHPIALDRDGDGLDEIAFYQPMTGLVHWADGSLPERVGTGSLRIEEGLPIVGDWQGDGLESLAIYEPGSGLLAAPAADGGFVYHRLPADHFASGWSGVGMAGGTGLPGVGLYDFDNGVLRRHAVRQPGHKACTQPGCPGDCGGPNPWDPDCEDSYVPPPMDPPDRGDCTGPSCGS